MGLKKYLKSLIFKEGTYIKSLFGPYKGIYFFHGPQMKKRTVVYYKAQEKHVAQWLQQYVKPGGQLMIIGAHVGIHVLHAAKLVGKNGLVAAFEPWPENFETLKLNLAKNDFSQVRPESIALSDVPGTTQLFQGFTDGTHSLDAEWIGNPQAKSIQVPISTVDIYCQQNNLVPELILIDVEGHDLNVLEGAKGIIQEHKPTLIVEHHEDRKKGSKQGILDFFTAQGYKWVEVERHFLATAK